MNITGPVFNSTRYFSGNGDRSCNLFATGFLFFFFFPFIVSSQHTITDTAARRTAIDHIIQFYTDSAKENLRVYDGYEFTSAYRASAGHPFFEYAEPHDATIVYQGTRYHHVLLSYDITNDEVLFVNPVTKLNIRLISSKIGEFEIGGHIFIRLFHDDEIDGFPGEGFYVRLLDGKAQVLAKRQKKLRDPAAAEAAARFIQVNNYFVVNNGTVYRVDSRRSLLAACNDRRAEVARYIQDNRLKFDKEPAQAIVKAVDFYNQIRN